MSKHQYYLCKEIFFLVSLIAGLTLVLFFFTWGIKNRFTWKIPLGWEKKLRKLIELQLNLDQRAINHAQVQRAINKITQRLTPALPPHDYDLKVVVMKSAKINALAFPGGLIVVYGGLVQKTTCPQELAAVLAHELGHVVARDPLKAITGKLMVGIALALFSPQQQVVWVNRIIEHLITSGYSRFQEKKADDFACRLLAKQGIDPVHLANFFKILQKIKPAPMKSRQKTYRHFQKVTAYVGSHPLLRDRIERIWQASQAFQKQKASSGPDFDLDWAAVKRAVRIVPSWEKLL